MFSVPASMIFPVPIPIAQPLACRSRSRVVLIASSDSSLRQRLGDSLSGLRWQVLEAPGGAEAWIASQGAQLEALLIDAWLPDLDVAEFLKDFHQEHPQVDMMMTDGEAAPGSPRSAYHQELLYALRRCLETDTAAWNAAPAMERRSKVSELPALQGVTPVRLLAESSRVESRVLLECPEGSSLQQAWQTASMGEVLSDSVETRKGAGVFRSDRVNAGRPQGMAPAVVRRSGVAVERIPELVGSSPAMLEVSRRIRLVAGRSTPVLIEGPTGSGKELVAEALHRLSGRSTRPFVAINCAAIPEALLEAELFGHTRGAFTGAVQGRVGRIQAADGGTLFLDEIGEMPLALQSKLLRFVESGELQRIGDNETLKVDVRILAATHQRLAEDAQKGVFRSDLYYRLAVFLIRTPALAEHMEDLSLLVGHFVEKMGRKMPVKRIDASAMATLEEHDWPGNVRELEHVLERASILAGDEPEITAAEIDFGFSLAN